MPWPVVPRRAHHGLAGHPIAPCRRARRHGVPACGSSPSPAGQSLPPVRRFGGKCPADVRAKTTAVKLLDSSWRNNGLPACQMSVANRFHINSQVYQIVQGSVCKFRSVHWANAFCTRERFSGVRRRRYFRSTDGRIGIFASSSPQADGFAVGRSRERPHRTIKCCVPCGLVSARRQSRRLGGENAKTSIRQPVTGTGITSFGFSARDCSRSWASRRRSARWGQAIASPKFGSCYEIIENSLTGISRSKSR